MFRSYQTGAEVTASVDNVVSTNRSTCLGSETVRVDTVEHILSALYGCGVTDAVVLFDGTELPIGDGSSLPFVELIESVGVTDIEGDLPELSIHTDIVVSDGKGSVLTAVPSDDFWITTVLDYTAFPALGMIASGYTNRNYSAAIAPARTYGFHHELEALRAAGLGLGAGYDNVVALGADGGVDALTPLRMPDELVRHKMLDMIGDLSLSQKKIKIGVVAVRPSHTLNIRLCKELLKLEEESGVL